MNKTGLRRYMYEYMFAQVIERVKAQTGEPFMASRARAVRRQVEGVLVGLGSSMDDPSLGPGTFVKAVNEVVGGIDGVRTPFEGDEGKNFYNTTQRAFFSMVREDVEPGPRLAISPYDPRFSGRKAVMDGGTCTQFIPVGEIDARLGGDLAKVADYEATTRSGLKLYTSAERGGRQMLLEGGDLVELDDVTGMSRLRPFIPAKDYESLAHRVADAGAVRDESGRRTGEYDYSVFMTPQAQERAVAVMEHIVSTGEPYKVEPDLSAGQIRATLSDSRMSVRLTDARSDEHFVGRVYDDGASMYYMSTRKTNGSTRLSSFTPSPEQAVNLLKLAKGEPVERTDGRGLIGEAGTHREHGQEVNDAYSTSARMFSAIVGRDPDGGYVIVRRDASKRSNESIFLSTENEAEEYLRRAIDSAREAFVEELDVESLIAQYESPANAEAIADGTFIPQLSPDTFVASIQRGYWDVLGGDKADLLMPGANEAEYRERMETIGAMDVDDAGRRAAHDILLKSITYSGSPVEQVRAHAADSVDAIIGTFDARTVIDHFSPLAPGEPEAERVERFDPVRVAQYMTIGGSSFSNNDDLVAAMRKLSIDTDELMGNDSYNASIKDRLITFDADSAQDMATIDDPFLARQYETIASTLRTQGVTDAHVLIDVNGVVDWTGKREGTQSRTARSTKEVHGQLGQIFVPDEETFGAITTRFASGRNYMFVPGYDARIVPQEPGETRSYMERTRLRGYETQLGEAIRYQIAHDLSSRYENVGSTTSLNVVYRRIPAERHPVDYIEQARELQMGDDVINDIMRTEARRLRYAPALSMGAGVIEEYNERAALMSGVKDPSDDNYLDPWVLSGGRNITLLDETSRGYTDMLATGTARNQGAVRYLVEGASVDPVTGQITPSADPNDATPLMKNPVLAQAGYIKADRANQAFNNTMKSQVVTEAVGVAFTEMLGLNMQDAVVVSKRYAREHPARGVDGELRGLMVGDKVTDMNGNKGVISYVVDPDMDPDEAEELGVADMVRYFKLNEGTDDEPGLDWVVSPYSVFRFNPGYVREAMENGTRDLVDLEGNVTKGGIGYIRTEVLRQTTDAKNHFYGSDELAEGKGRKFGIDQANAALGMGASQFVTDMYAGNNAGVTNLRELLLTMGMDVSPTGDLLERYTPQEGEDRRVLEIPELRMKTSGSGRKVLDPSGMRRDFGSLIGAHGGLLPLPFELRSATGELFSKDEQGRTLLPVPSAYLRSGMELDDGTVTTHDFTSQFLTVFDSAIKYEDARRQLEHPEALTDQQAATYRKRVKDMPDTAQSAYSTVARGIDKMLGDYVKDKLGGVRLLNSGTLVWSPDSSLDVDQVAIGPAMAQSMGVKEDDHLLIWRNPVWREGGERYLRAKIDDSITGMRVHPTVAKSMDGDFDGDTIGLVKPAKRYEAELMETFSVEANLVDFSIKDPKDPRSPHPLNFDTGLDVASALYDDPTLRQRLEDCRVDANDVERRRAAGELAGEELMEARSDVMGRVGDVMLDGLSTRVGTNALSLADVPSFLESIEATALKTGAKGNQAGLEEIAVQLGAQRDASGAWNDTGATLADDASKVRTQYATLTKTALTGYAGKFNHRSVMALRGDALRATLNTTYTVTQSTLSLKHSDVQAERTAMLEMGPLRDLWKGRKMERSSYTDREGNRVPTWKPVRAERGRGFEQATTEEWIETFVDMHTDPLGLNVKINPDMVREIAKNLSDENGVIINIEDKDLYGGKDATAFDVLAYGSGEHAGFSGFHTMAIEGRNLFEGPAAVFAPQVIRDNVAELHAQELAIERGSETFEANLTPLAKVDTVQAGAGKGDRRRHASVQAVGSAGVRVRNAEVGVGAPDESPELGE